MSDYPHFVGAGRSVQLAERLILVVAWLSRKTEDALGQGVALNIVRPASESGRPLVQEGCLPEAIVERAVAGQHAVGPEQAHEQFPAQTHVLGNEEFGRGCLW